MNNIKSVILLGRKVRDIKKIPIKQPLKSITIINSN